MSVAAGQTAPADSHGVGFDLELALADLRHTRARAASDLADWLVHLDLEGKADRTSAAYSGTIKGLLLANPDKALGEFVAADVNDRLRKVPEGSRYIVRSHFNRFFAWAMFDERITKNPMNRVPKMRHPHRRPKDIFSEEEIGLLEAMSAPDGPLWALLFGSGLRRAEARHLRRQHIDLNRARLIVYRGKGSKDRIVPLSRHVLAAVADLDLLEQLRPEDHLWYSRRGARRLRRDPIGDTTFASWYTRGIEAAGVRYLNPHQTRHTFGHRLRERGFDLEERRLLMGHEDIATTARYYGTLTIEDVAKKVALL